MRIVAKFDRSATSARRAEHRKLAADLSHYTTESDLLELYTILDRYSLEETTEIRDIVSRRLTAA